MIVSHNLPAMNAQRQFGIVNQKRAKSTEKLSSGYRINRAADDAAGLAISEKMRRQIRGLTQGIHNTQEGVSVCQVADGALHEVNDILNRLEELAVKAANGTNGNEDREYIQLEVKELLAEINRISDATTFNEIPLFKGSDEVVKNVDGTPAIEGQIPFTDFRIADLTLGQSPISASSSGNRLALQAIVDSAGSASNGKTYNLIYGSGSTSDSSIRIKTAGMDAPEIINFDDMQISNFSQGSNADGKAYWKRDLTYQNGDVKIKIEQTIALNEDTNAIKDYAISYKIENQSSEEADVDFMFHADTAYNNNDRCEGYFIGNNRVDKTCIYSAPGSKFIAGSTNSNINTTGTPDSFSIVDVDAALAFSEKISFASGNKPDSLSIGIYSAIDDWGYYDNLNGNLGRNTERADLGFSAMWNYNMAAGASETASFTYGIAAVEQDSNLTGVQVNKSNYSVTNHKEYQPIWIQSGCESGVGMELIIGEMNTDVLGISNMNVSTVDGAQNAIDMVKNAQHNVMSNRSNIGAQQNRLEHTINNENNIVENTTAAESAIRDTDMAREMVNLSMQNVLAQAGQSMMAQANQSNEIVLGLLQ